MTDQPITAGEAMLDGILDQLRPVTDASDAIDKAAEALHTAITTAVKSLTGLVPPTGAPQPPNRDALWEALDWCLWGVGMADTFREPLADKMVGALNPDERAQALSLITDWRERRGGPSGLRAYEDLRAENEQLRAAAPDNQPSNQRKQHAMTGTEPAENLYLVKVGTDADTAHSRFVDGAGSDLYGPYTTSKAAQLAEQVRAEFATHDDREFLYGLPIVEIIPRRPEDATTAQMVSNWVRPDYEEALADFERVRVEANHKRFPSTEDRNG